MSNQPMNPFDGRKFPLMRIPYISGCSVAICVTQSLGLLRKFKYVSKHRTKVTLKTSVHGRTGGSSDTRGARRASSPIAIASAIPCSNPWVCSSTLCQFVFQPDDITSRRIPCPSANPMPPRKPVATVANATPVHPRRAQKIRIPEIIPRHAPQPSSRGGFRCSFSATLNSRNPAHHPIAMYRISALPEPHDLRRSSVSSSTATIASVALSSSPTKYVPRRNRSGPRNTSCRYHATKTAQSGAKNFVSSSRSSDAASAAPAPPGAAHKNPIRKTLANPYSTVAESDDCVYARFFMYDMLPPKANPPAVNISQ